MRTAINQVRAGVGLAAYAWQYSVTTNDWITANPILEMRTALDQALGAPSPAYSAGLAQGQPILAIHLQELRERIKAALGSSALSQYYDGDRLRAKKSEYGATTFYVRSSVLGGQVVAELNGSGAWTRGYVYLGGQMLAIQGGSGGQVSWVHQDPVTKSQRVTNSAGTVTSAIDLDPWGGETNRSANSAFQPHKYTTYERDGNGGDEAMHRRYQSNWTRFSQPDPYDGSYSLTDPQSLNRYSYTQNDPVNFVDPSGLNACSAAFSYEQCGGEEGFWRRPGDSGGGGGGGGFGDDVAAYNRNFEGVPGHVVGAYSDYLTRLQNTYEAMDANRALQRYISSEGTDEEALQALARLMAGNSSLTFAMQSRGNQAQPAVIGPILARILTPIGRALIRLLGRGRATAAAATASTSLKNVEDIFSNPRLLAGRTPGEIVQLLRSTSNWFQTPLGRGSHQGQGMVLREVGSNGRLTGRIIQWHPGGGHHGASAYWKVSSPQGGIVRIPQ